MTSPKDKGTESEWRYHVPLRGTIDARDVLLRDERSTDGVAETERLAKWDSSWVKAAPVWWVNDDMVRLLEAAYPSMPDQTLTHYDVPAPTGLVFLQRPVSGGPGNEHPIHALSWRSHEFGGGQLHDALGALLIGWTRYHVDDAPLFWAPSAASSWMFGTGWADVPDEVLAEHALRRDDDPVHRQRMAAFWTLTAQTRLVEQTADRPPRAERRRNERADDPIIDPINVVRLRIPRHATTGDGTGSDREFSHRWMVNGHWRNQYLPSIDGHRLQWIAPYVKGPDDKPLVVKETVRAWVK